MKCVIHNKTNRDMSQLENEITAFYPYAQQKLGFNRPATVELLSDPKNASKTFGRTAYYSPSADTVSVYVDGRHIKDVLRSISHELVHHTQNCRGEFENAGSTEEGYAQKDPHLRKMEAEAYLMGNGFLFRDYEDQLKKENKKMQLKDAIKEAIAKVMSEEEHDEEKKDKKCPKCKKTKDKCECPKNEEVELDENEEALEEMFNMSTDPKKHKGPGHEATHAAKNKDKKKGPDHEATHAAKKRSVYREGEDLHEAFWPTKDKNVLLNKELMKRWCK
mgnify:CR=1 FL=1